MAVDLSRHWAVGAGCVHGVGASVAARPLSDALMLGTSTFRVGPHGEGSQGTRLRSRCARSSITTASPSSPAAAPAWTTSSCFTWRTAKTSLCAEQAGGRGGGVIAGVVFVGTDSGPTRAADGQLLQISVSGEFLLTCFGLPLETLCSMPHPARSDEVRR